MEDKETPITPDYVADGYADGYPAYDEWICPRCGEEYEVEVHWYEYCPNCGQHIAHDKAVFGL